MAECPGDLPLSFTLMGERKERKKVKLLSRVQLFATPWAIACQYPPSMGFPRQEYWSGVPFPSLGDPVFVPGESQGRGSLMGFCLWGRTESDTTKAT